MFSYIFFYCILKIILNRFKSLDFKLLIHARFYLFCIFNANKENRFYAHNKIILKYANKILRNCDAKQSECTAIYVETTQKSYEICTSILLSFFNLEV